jgi:DNA-binding NtrC family response regulator
VEQASPRIMIVDDVDADVESIMRAFRKAGSPVSFRLAGTLAQFLREAEDDPPDIALLNLQLPDGNSIDILKKPIIQRPFPILVMSGDCNVKMAVK